VPYVRTLRYGTLRIDTYGSTIRYGFLRYVTLRYVRVENRHYLADSHWRLTNGGSQSYVQAGQGHNSVSVSSDFMALYKCCFYYYYYYYYICNLSAKNVYYGWCRL